MKYVFAMESINKKSPKQQILSLSSLTGTKNDSVQNPRIVKLTKSPSGYGFFLKMVQASPMHIIDQIERGSPADLAKLQSGDVLACVNGVDVMHLPHWDCVELIKSSGDSVELTVAPREVMLILYQHGVGVSPDFLDRWKYLNKEIYSYSNDAFEESTSFDSKLPEQRGNLSLGGLADGAGALIMNQEFQKQPIKSRFVPEPLILSSTDSLPEDLEQSPLPPRAYQLEKGRDGFGFQLAETDDVGRHYISQISKGGPAELAGLREGDRLLEVNEVATFDKTHEDIVQMIYNNVSKLNLVVIDDGPLFKGMEIKSDLNQEFDRRSVSSCASAHECRLTKRSDESFEFFLMVDNVRNAQVIMSVTPKGPADRSGLRNGDRVIEVNGINVENKDHADVVKLIKQSVPNNEVTLLVTGEKRSLYRNSKEKSCIVS